MDSTLLKQLSDTGIGQAYFIGCLLGCEVWRRIDHDDSAPKGFALKSIMCDRHVQPEQSRSSPVWWRYFGVVCVDSMVLSTVCSSS